MKRDTRCGQGRKSLLRSHVCNFLFFWRAAVATGVDFVAYGGDGPIAIKAQRTRAIRRADFHGYREVHADYPMARCVLLFGGERREHRDGIGLLPLTEQLADPALVLG